MFALTLGEQTHIYQMQADVEHLRLPVTFDITACLYMLM